MKFIGLAVVRDEDDIIEVWVRHSLQYLDRLYVADDGSADGTPAILERLAAELPALVVVKPAIGAEINRLFQHAVAEQGAATYFPMAADQFLLFTGYDSPAAVKAALADLDGNTILAAFRLAVLAGDGDGAGRFRHMESLDEVRRVGRTEARTAVIRIADPGHADTVALELGGHAIGHAFQTADGRGICYAFVPVRSPEQLVKKAFGSLLGGTGTGRTSDPHLRRVTEIIKTRDLTAADLWPLSLDRTSTIENGTVRLQQGDLSGLFRYEQKYAGLRRPVLGTLAQAVTVRVAGLERHVRAFEDIGLLNRARDLISAGDLAEARRSLERRLLDFGADYEVLEVYFDVIERAKARDVPQTILAQAADLSNPARSAIGPLADGRLYLNYLEMDISFACNLRCDGCSHYSNYAMPGVVRLAQASGWMKTWADRLFPRQFRLLGGEPAINPDAAHIIRAAAEIFPHAARSLVSNGLLLHKRADIMQALSETATGLCLSIHDHTEKTRDTLNNVRKWAQDLGIVNVLVEGFPENFTRLYRGEGKEIRPFDDRKPFTSWACCAEKNCTCIHDGLLWKCPPLAFLNLLDRRIHLAGNPEWTRYLAHRGLPPTATNEELYAYLAYPERDCDMCPAIRPRL